MTRALIDPYRFAVAVTPLGLLDSYTTNLWAVCWMRRLLTSWTGAVIRVRRSSDNTEQDIGYAANNSLDSAALLTFAGAGDAFVTKLYDQTGNSRDAVQATSGKQPRIVSGGVYDGFLRFDGTDDCLRIASNSGTPSAISLASRASLRSVAVTSFLLEHGDAVALSGGHNDCIVYNEISGSQRTNLLISTGTSYRLNDAQGTTIDGVMGAVFDYSQTTSAKCKLWKNGSSVGMLTGLSGSEPTGPFTAEPWNFCARNNGASGAAPANASGFVIWQGVMTSNMPAISSILAEGAA